MAHGGIQVDDDVLRAFNDMKLLKTTNYLFFVVSLDRRKIILRTSDTPIPNPVFKPNNEIPEELNLACQKTIYVLNLGLLSILPPEILRIIYLHCTGYELFLLSSTCRSFWHDIMNPEIWQTSTQYHLTTYLFDPNTSPRYLRTYEVDYITLWKIYHRHMQSLSWHKPKQFLPDTPEKYWNRFLSMFPVCDCCYAVFRFPYKDNNGEQKEKLLFIVWTPENAPIKSKMMYAGSKDVIKKALIGINCEMGGTEDIELSYECVREKCISSIIK